MKDVGRIAVLYAVFATLATMVNIGCQALAIGLYQGQYTVPLSIFLGTAAGLPVKYVLEKRHIFRFESDNPTHDCKMFVLYSLMGVFKLFPLNYLPYLFEKNAVVVEFI